MKEQFESERGKTVEQICELDDALIEKYLNGEEISIEELKAALRKAVIKKEIVPVMAGSSLRNKGVQPMLDAVMAGRRVVTNVAGISEDLVHEYLVNNRDAEPTKLGSIVYVPNERIM